MSENALRGLLGALALAGFAISAYLTYNHLNGTVPACVGGPGGCASVQASRYSEVLGVPVALIGLFGYAAMLLAALVRDGRAAILGVFVAMTGTLFSLYLTYLELFVIRAICQWCVASAAVVVAYLVVAIGRLRWTGTAASGLAKGYSGPDDFHGRRRAEGR